MTVNKHQASRDRHETPRPAETGGASPEASTRPKHYALIGHPLRHSLSPFIHDHVMAALGIEGRYELIDLSPDAMEEAGPRLEALDGYNVTIPHKETVFRTLRHKDPLSTRLGAVNTVCRGKGYNTDILGFARVPIAYDGRHVLLLGAGGTCRIMAHHAAASGAASLTFMVRNVPRAAELADDLGRHYPNLEIRVIRSDELSREIRGQEAPYHVLLNGTPVGMWPRTGELPFPERAYKRLLRSGRVESVFDAIYNPTATRFVLIARSHHVTAYGGADMLFYQAVAAQSIWQGGPADADPAALVRTVYPEGTLDDRARDEKIEALDEVRRKLSAAIAEHSPIKWVLTGFMASGKSRMAKRLARELPFPVTCYDLDREIVRESGMSIEDYFAAHGEASFRRLERKVLLDLLRRPHAMIIASGGGTITEKGCVHDIHRADGVVINLQVSFRTARRRIGDGRNRPLAQGPDADRKLHDLYQRRYPVYRATADFIVNANRYPPKVGRKILAAFDLEPPSRDDSSRRSGDRDHATGKSRRDRPASAEAEKATEPQHKAPHPSKPRRNRRPSKKKRGSR